MRKETHKNIPNNIWQLQEAKAKLSEVVEKANRDGYQIITRKGEPIVVVLSQVEFNRLHEPKRSLVEFFKRHPILN